MLSETSPAKLEADSDAELMASRTEPDSLSADSGVLFLCSASSLLKRLKTDEERDDETFERSTKGVEVVMERVLER